MLQVNYHANNHFIKREEMIVRMLLIALYALNDGDFCTFFLAINLINSIQEEYNVEESGKLKEKTDLSTCKFFSLPKKCDEPWNPNSYATQGNQYFQQGNYEAMFDCYRHLLQEDNLDRQIYEQVTHNLWEVLTYADDEETSIEAENMRNMFLNKYTTARHQIPEFK